MGIKFNTDLSDSFRKARGQSTESSSNTDLKGIPEKHKRSSNNSSASYSSFITKYRDLEHSFVRFTTQDLVYRTQPTVLASNWVNTIYTDSLDWANDSYTEKKKSKKTENREWKKTDSNKKIGEWE